MARIIELMYMLNIVGSFTICIQPIYAIFEKNESKKEKDEPADPEDSTIQNETSFRQVAQEQS